MKAFERMRSRNGADSRSLTGFVLVLWIVLPLLAGTVFPEQKVKADVSNYTELFFDELKNLVMPKNAVPLEWKLTLGLATVRTPRRMARDSNGDFFLIEAANGAVTKFSPEGAADEEFAKNAAKRKRTKSPQSLAARENMLFVQDQDKIIQMDGHGSFVHSMGVSFADDMAIDETGEIFLSPLIIESKTPLVEIYSAQGKRLRTFGEAMNFRYNLAEMNKRRLVISGDDVFVIFRYFPVVRRYRKTGELLGEYRIEDRFTAIKENYNLRRIGEGIANPSKRYGYMEITEAAAALDGFLYVISGYPILMIYEISAQGQIHAIYWKDTEEVYVPRDFAIEGSIKEIRFFVLRDSVQASLDVFVANRKK